MVPKSGKARFKCNPLCKVARFGASVGGTPVCSKLRVEGFPGKARFKCNPLCKVVRFGASVGGTPVCSNPSG